MKRSTFLYATLLACSLLTINQLATGASSSSSKTRYSLWSGRARVSIPKTASAPKRVNNRTFSIRPKSKELKFVIYVARDPLRKDELKMTNKQLASSVRTLLESQGFQILDFKTVGSSFTVDFRAFAQVPWQKVGTTYTRGTAKFTRTAGNELVGSILYCDSRQWKNPATMDFRKVVTGTTVAKN
jgi:hypothetical protein